jgi:hypothetical protein
MWGIVEEHKFCTELASLLDDPVRADEFVDGAKNVLSRDPEAGTKINNTVWFLPMGIGNLAIYYRFDNDNVHLLSIR